MKLLDQEFVAVKYSGEEVSVWDLEQLIKDNGPHWFISAFGFSHNIVPYNEAANEYNKQSEDYYTGKSKTSPNRRFSPYGKDLSYEYQWVLVNGKGNNIDPLNVLEEYFERYPKEAIPKWRRNTCKKNRLNLIIGHHKINDHPMLKAFHGVIKSEGEPEIKKKKVLFTCPWDDHYPKIGQRNWKSFRKTQYK